MTFKPRQLNHYTQDQLQSTFALDLFTQLAHTLPSDVFTSLVTEIFGADLTVQTYALLRDRLLAGEITNPKILIGTGDYAAEYDNRHHTIAIDQSVLDRALAGTGSARLLDVLLHEFGHHIDNLLRSELSSAANGDAPLPAPDADGEEGARFSFWVSYMAVFDEATLRIASYQDPEQDQTVHLEVDWAAAQLLIAQHFGRGQDGHSHPHPDREAFEAGHGDDHHMTHHQIEQALLAAGFSPEEMEQIYFGNWLRDYSQLLDPKLVRAASMPKNFPDVLSREALTKIVDVLSIKPFAKLRSAMPEHYTVTPDKLGVYRPSEHIDNPKTGADETSDPRLRDPDFEPLVRAGDFELEVDYNTSMKNYLERSERFMMSELDKAMRAGRTPEGMRALGSALHVLEDLFAHSNFVELSLIKIGYNYVVPWTSQADCKAGLPLVTGMFGPTDVIASLAEPLGKALFGTDSLVFQPLKPGDRSEREQILLILFDEHPNPRYLEIFQHFLEARDGFVGKPFSDYLQRCLHYFTGMMGVLGNATGVIMHDALKLLGNHVDDWQTQYGQDPTVNGSTDPTHSQLAKDHADHPLHSLAAILAHEAVLRVGAAMNRCWNGERTRKSHPMAAADGYFRHPFDVQWQDSIISTWAAAHPEEIRRSESKRELAAVHQHLWKTATNLKEQLRKDGAHYLDFLRGEIKDPSSPIYTLLRSRGTSIPISTAIKLIERR